MCISLSGKQNSSGYNIQPINDAVEKAVHDFLERVSAVPKQQLLSIANKREASMAEVAFKQAAQEFEEAQRQVSALEAEAVKALTGESQLDLKVVNSMLLKHRAKLEGATATMEEAKARIEEEAKSRKANEIRVDELLSWAGRFDEASYEAKHLVISQLVDRIEVKPNYEVSIHFRITAEQFLGKPVAASA